MQIWEVGYIALSSCDLINLPHGVYFNLNYSVIDTAWQVSGGRLLLPMRHQWHENIFKWRKYQEIIQSHEKF